MQELVKKVDSEVVVADPFVADTYHNAADVAGLVRSATDRLAQRKREIAEMGDLAAMAVPQLKAVKKSLKADDDTLKDFDLGIRDELLTLSGFKAFAVQVKGTGARIDALSVRGQLAALIKQIDEAIDAQTPAAPTHTYVIKATVDDATLTKILKLAGSDAFWAVPQSDKAAKSLDHWFKENA